MFFDFDNDGWPDLILANGHVYREVDCLAIGIQYQEPKLLDQNSGKGTFKGTFKDVSQESGAWNNHTGIWTWAGDRCTASIRTIRIYTNLGPRLGLAWNPSFTDRPLGALLGNRRAVTLVLSGF